MTQILHTICNLSRLVLGNNKYEWKSNCTAPLTNSNICLQKNLFTLADVVLNGLSRGLSTLHNAHMAESEQDPS